jgi:DNA repair protein RadC
MNDRPHFHGHRQRLRERFLRASGEALHDYEMLELVLFQANARGDMKPLAKALLKRFGSFAATISAAPERLGEVEGVGDATIAALKTIQAAALRLSRDRILDKPVLSSWQALIDYCNASMRFSTTEQFSLLFLDRKNTLIANEVQQTGTVDHTPVYPREVMKRAMNLGASAVIMVHNHPSGDPTPSGSDIEMTKEVAEAGRRLGVTLHDHVIVGRGTHVSCKSLGLL